MLKNRPQKMCLLILDGWGIGNKDSKNAIYTAKTPFMDSLAKYPNNQLLTHGEHVGLPPGQMGNSEVGHINLGAGRIVYQELARINRSIESGEILKQDSLQKLIQEVKDGNKKLHLLGLVSDGGVHSHINHFTGLIELFSQQNIQNIAVHAFTDGRDTDPHSGLDFITELEQVCDENNAQIASVIGRYYAMDRDKRWERTKLAYDLLVNGVGEKVDSITDAIQNSYDQDVTDEFIKPIVQVDSSGEPVAKISNDDVVLFVNFRTDRPRQLTTVLTQKTMPDYEMKPLDLSFYSMTNYDQTYQGIHIIFEKDNVDMPLGELLSNKGLQQIRIAETEKYPHVTFFFNGGREVEFEGERRILINSPKVATYDLQPEMSAGEITDAILPELEQENPDFVCLNFANTDMVGHTGVFEAAVKAAETVDQCVQKIVTTGLDHGYQFLIIADHGNSEYMINEDGSPNTAHTTNPVPVYYVGEQIGNRKIKAGILADVAPTILYIMGLEQPEIMTGENLITE